MTEVVAAIGEVRWRLAALHEALLDSEGPRPTAGRAVPDRAPPRAATGGRAEAAPRTGVSVPRTGDHAAGPSRPGPAAGGPGLYATLLGAFAVYRGPLRLGLGHHRSVLELGRYLIARSGRFVPREELLELLWPDSDPEQGRHRLHNAVSKLRRVVDAPQGPSVIRCEEDGYAIDREGLETDCDRFEAYYGRGRQRLARGDEAGAAEAFGAALELYGGDYLAEVPYAEWAHQHRAHFAERRMNALTYLCEHALRLGELPRAIDRALEVLIADNLRERAHRHVMRAHHGLGQRACAIRQYHLCAALLEKELGVRPSEATQRLHRAIRDDAELPPEPPFHP
jgi:DNA-binding SARP family transcriptional activator